MRHFAIKNYRITVLFGGTKNLKSSVHIGIKFRISVPQADLAYISLIIGILILIDLTIQIRKV
jgi:hypothetical protein